MLTQPQRQDVLNYLMGRIGQNEDIRYLLLDGGVSSLASVLGYKIDQSVAQQNADLSEFFYPTSELFLLSKLLYEVGYMKFPRPLKVRAKITSNDDVVVPQYERFTNGTDVFLLEEGTTLMGGQAKYAIFSRELLVQKNIVVTSEKLFFKVLTELSYKEITRVEAYKNGTLLKYSQQFIDYSSDYSYEIRHDGTMQLVFSIGNTMGQNIQGGDTITVNIFKTSRIETPDNLSTISQGYDIIVEEVELYDVGEDPMTIEEMQDIIKYRKNINATLIYNDDYRWHILQNVAGIKELKVWQQEQEDAENGVESCNMNKLFLTYIPNTDGTNLNQEITDLIWNTMYGKVVSIKEPFISDVSVTIDILYNTSQEATTTAIENIKSKIVGYYDNQYSRITKYGVTALVFTSLSGIDIDLEVDVSGTETLSNRSFNRVLYDNITINTARR